MTQSYDRKKAWAGTHVDAGFSFVVGPPVTGVPDLAQVHDIDDIHAVAGVSLL